LFVGALLGIRFSIVLGILEKKVSLDTHEGPDQGSAQSGFEADARGLHAIPRTIPFELMEGLEQH